MGSHIVARRELKSERARFARQAPRGPSRENFSRWAHFVDEKSLIQHEYPRQIFASDYDFKTLRGVGRVEAVLLIWENGVMRLRLASISLAFVATLLVSLPETAWARGGRGFGGGGGFRGGFARGGFIGRSYGGFRGGFNNFGWGGNRFGWGGNRGLGFPRYGFAGFNRGWGWRGGWGYRPYAWGGGYRPWGWRGFGYGLGVGLGYGLVGNIGYGGWGYPNYSYSGCSCNNNWDYSNAYSNTANWGYPTVASQVNVAPVAPAYPTSNFSGYAAKNSTAIYKTAAAWGYPGAG